MIHRCVSQKWIGLFSFCSSTLPLAFPCSEFYNQVRWLFFTKLVSDFPKHSGGARLSHRELHYCCDAFWAAVNWNVFILKAWLWKSDFTFWVANEITTLMPNWDWYCTLKRDKEQLCLPLWLPLMKGFPSQLPDLCTKKQSCNCTALRAPASLSVMHFSHGLPWGCMEGK